MSKDQDDEFERLKTGVSTIKKIGVKKALFITIMYVWSLFILCVAVVSLGGFLTGADIYGLGFTVMSAVSFAVISGIDLYLLYSGKYSFVLCLWLIPISLGLTIRAVVRRMDSVPLNTITLPTQVRKYVFLMNSKI